MTWYREAQSGDNKFSNSIIPSIYLEDSVLNKYDVRAEPVNVPFSIDIEMRDWGIKGIEINAVDTIVVIVNFSKWEDADIEYQREILVDLSKLSKEETNYGHGSYTVTDLELHLDGNLDIVYDKSNIIFSKG